MKRQKKPSPDVNRACDPGVVAAERLAAVDGIDDPRQLLFLLQGLHEEEMTADGGATEVMLTAFRKLATLGPQGEGFIVKGLSFSPEAGRRGPAYLSPALLKQHLHSEGASIDTARAIPCLRKDWRGNTLLTQKDLSSLVLNAPLPAVRFFSLMALEEAYEVRGGGESESPLYVSTLRALSKHDEVLFGMPGWHHLAGEIPLLRLAASPRWAFLPAAWLTFKVGMSRALNVLRTELFNRAEARPFADSS